MNSQKLIDLRSDTVTKPTPAMRRAIAEAEVGDDVFGDDPTVNRLQARFASLMGKESAIFVPSGSMANQISIRALTEPGDEIIASGESHFYFYEAGAPAGLSGCSMRFVESDRGIFEADAVREAIRPRSSHFAKSRLVIIENTHNRGGGSVWPLEKMAAIRRVAVEYGLATHLDGARLMNACVASGVSASDYAQHFDTVSSCFSKGLGAPVGSAVAGSGELIERIHRFRKMFGGGMRQVGILAAAALHALDHHVDRLSDDHSNAKRLAEGVDALAGLSVDVSTVETNIVFIDVDPGLGSAAELCDRLAAAGVRVLPTSPKRLRAVTHLDVSRADIDRAVEVFSDVLAMSSPS